jgi:hypothetical protein
MLFLIDPMILPRRMLKFSLLYVEHLKVVLVYFPYFAVFEFVWLDLCNNSGYCVLKVYSNNLFP